MTGADGAVRRAGFPAVEAMTVAWDTAPAPRAMPPGSLLVDRDRFDALLVDRAVELGVTVIAAAAAMRRQRCASGWEVELNDGATVRARFVVDAGGRPSSLRQSRPDALLGVTGRWNVALDRPTVVAVDDGWIWASSDGSQSCEVTVFVDPRAWRALGSDPVAATCTSSRAPASWVQRPDWREV